MTQRARKLGVHRETLRELNEFQMPDAAGGQSAGCRTETCMPTSTLRLSECYCLASQQVNSCLVCVTPPPA
ncbi:MAG TPA: hypothetical protein VG245_01860 [Candidatus Dormibacteraeota bacterium]|jgi:hypothetical protein|nr:hypothetical protein [Candidatus Dormibacteraeota bacterium]